MDEEEILSVEAQQTQEQPATIKYASAVAVAYFGDHMQKKHSENNQDFINEYEVTCVCVCVVFLWSCCECAYVQNF